MTLINQLLYYYKLDGNSTDTIAAANGSDTSITYSAGNGKIIQGAGFNGSTSNIVLPNNDWSATTAYSLQVWFKTSATTEQIFISRDNASGAGRILQFRMLGGADAGKINFVRFDSATNVVSNFQTTGTYNDGNWHHCVATFDNTVGSKIYIDGTQVVSDAVTTNNRGGTGSSPYIGIFNGSTSPMNGALDEVGIWNRGITAAEVTELYNLSLGIQHPFILGPTLTTQAVSSIDLTTATGNGTVVADNGSTVTQRGICWNTSSSPTISNSIAIVSGTTGVFTASMTGLIAGTNYYVRAFATNALGTSYGNEVAFLTLSVSATQLINPIDATEGQAYAVSVNVGGTLGSVTVKLGTTGTSQVINAGAGVTVFQGTYGGLSGIIFEMSATFNGWIDDVMYVAVTGDAVINWVLNTLTNIFAIDSSVLFKRIESKEFNAFRFFRYLDIMFKDLDAYVTVTIKQEQSDNVRTKTKVFIVDNPAAITSPFIKKKISFLSKNQAILIGVSNNNKNETFTICKFDLKGYEENKRLFKGSNIINVV